MTALVCPYCKSDLSQDGIGEVVIQTAEAGDVLTLCCESCRAPLGFLRLALPKGRLPEPAP
ncbi:MAG TPA: hypothetical protein VJ986_06595 [Gaiellaceae bacterium]|nr:hypothetical protein [Gaiellaceae bacterium]